MVYAVQASASFNNVNQLNRAHQAVLDWLATHVPWGTVHVEETMDESGRPRILVEVRFTTREEMVELYDLAVANFPTQGWLAGSWVSRHECTHDQPVPQPCVEEVRFTA